MARQVSRIGEVASYAIQLDWPPTANTHWRRAGKFIHLSDQGRRFREDVGKQCLLAGYKPLTGRLGVRLELTPPDARRCDIDNRIKPTLDALEGWCFENDEQIDELIVVRLAPSKPGGCLAIVSQLGR